jgi:hypothetical protein
MRLLEEVRADPTGWPSVDLHKLLNLCGFTSSEPLKTTQGWDVPLRFHPEHPDLNVVLFPTERVHVAVTLHVVRIIDTLAARLAQSGAHGSTGA